ncbi:MAG: Mur ligase family protein [Candidatus Shapirobacteria bacterium]
MHIHLVGIAGSMTAPLALALQKQGHQISGSDQEKTYPPFNKQLKKANIPINQTEINSQIDLAIIGSSYASFHNTQTDFEDIKIQKIPYISATQYISQNLIKNNSILIAGSYGKTTITAAVTYLLKNANYDPAYMIGGQSLNRLDSLHFSNSNWSVVEADESINGLDTKAKFLYYPVKYLILTSAKWEHRESYSNENENFNAFKQLVENIPKDGLLIYNSNDTLILPLLSFAKCQKIPYSETKISNQLLGKHNQENLGAVETLANKLKISSESIKRSFKNFKGIKRRLEVVGNNKGIIFIDDFAQSADRIGAALKAIKDTHPQSRLKVFYENHASFMQYRSNLNLLLPSFELATETVIYKLKFNSKIKQSDRLIAKDFLNIIPRSIYLPIPEEIVKHYQNSLKTGDILVHFSSGGSDGLKIFQKIINLYKNNK